MIPPWSADTIHSPEYDHTIARTAVSCACCVVSKVKLMPDHIVNICIQMSTLHAFVLFVMEPWLRLGEDSDPRMLISEMKASARNTSVVV